MADVMIESTNICLKVHVHVSVIPYNLLNSMLYFQQFLTFTGFDLLTKLGVLATKAKGNGLPLSKLGNGRK